MFNLNKTNLNKIIKWTSSKFNIYKKSEIINKLLKMANGETIEFSCGSYSESGYNGGYHYKAEMSKTYYASSLTLINKNTREEYKLGK
ncbi:MAG: hypothetical protein ACI4PF_03825 [Christensenellales bacterium]